MSRRVDPALTKRALSALKRAADKAKLSEEGLTEWEAEFLGSVEERLTKFGSAFADPDKGQLSAPLSLRQGLKVRQISKKGETEADKKPRTGFKAKDKPPTPTNRKSDKPKSDRPKPDKPRKPLARKTGLTSKGFRPKRAD
ncbi:MAG: hypothetical protein CFE27_11465 [Alphaproteobacteria bacterium PA1]|nr:MAG: hypothetical protein CFE27_11465 [Alphaproteobacteria bacterium PA1]